MTTPAKLPQRALRLFITGDVANADDENEYSIYELAPAPALASTS